ncbi:AraC family transcriptional regulator [uncultured Pelagimonas sp.]|uniref:AraC family transcriptional regulator n=1 Tax=uncultured Pelagimonas sp. TaxID=1618102 RepID=UPI00260F4328|nr:AraC family transcriptional regulator [uncultured Pelagimonas sp.]
MPMPVSPPVLPTVSRAFVQDWIESLYRMCPPDQVSDMLYRSGLRQERIDGRGRVTHDQIVKLYQIVVSETGDEMMGLWSRIIRPGALKHLCASVLGASSLAAALYRFSTFWNLVLDDHHLSLSETDRSLILHIRPISGANPSRFGHMLMLKLAHGVASWLALRELPLTGVGFTFPKPGFAQDYPILFPGPIVFDETTSWIGFDKALGDLPVSRSEADMTSFLQRAPRDWIFTNSREHALPLRIRELLVLSPRMDCDLGDAARHLHVTPRTLIRRLKSEGTSFQAIKDGVRRDMALRDLATGKPIEAISQDTGFATPASFYRAFRGWTGQTPRQYRDDMCT